MKNTFVGKVNINTLEFTLLESNGLQQFTVNNGLYFSHFLYPELESLNQGDFLLNMKGMFIDLQNNSITFFSDIYRSVPLYYFHANEYIYIFSDFISMAKYTEFPTEMDHAGFWEYLLFGNGIYDRTIYKEIKQFPAAGKLFIDSNSASLDYYWDFNFYEKNCPSDKEEVILDFKKILLKSFEAELNQTNDSLTLGLSGGMDSRLAFSLMDELDLLTKTNFFTYGYSEKILEAKVAKDLLNLKKLSEYSFHKLTKESYSKAFDHFPQVSAASVGSSHVHMYDYLSENTTQNLISTYYSDAVFGYASSLDKKIDTWENVDYISVLNRYSQYISPELVCIIKQDIKNSLKNFDPKANYSSVNEYKYIVERNPKFHMNLLFLQSQIVGKTFSPFASYTLLKKMIELPIEYRFDKNLIRGVISSIDDKIISNIGDTSNQRVYFKKNFKSIVNNLLTNRQAIGVLANKAINLILYKISKGKLHLFDQYATEIHSNVLASSFYDELIESTKYFVEIGLIDGEFEEKLNSIPAYGNETSLRFEIIDLYKLLSNGNIND